MGYLCLMVVHFDLEVGHLSCLVEVLCCQEVVLLSLVVDRLVSCLEEDRLSLVVFVLVGRLDLLLVDHLVLVLVYYLVVVLYLLLVSNSNSLFFSLTHQLSKQPQAHHHQKLQLKYLGLSIIPSVNSSW